MGRLLLGEDEEEFVAFTGDGGLAERDGSAGLCGGLEVDFTGEDLPEI